MLTTAARLAPERASVSAAMPPKQNPTAARRPFTSLRALSAASPAAARWASRSGGVAETHQRGHDALPIARHAASVHIAGQDDVPELGVPIGLASGMVIQPGTTVDEEDAGALVAPPFIEHDNTIERRAAVRVLQVLRRQGHRHLQ